MPDHKCVTTEVVTPTLLPNAIPPSIYNKHMRIHCPCASTAPAHKCSAHCYIHCTAANCTLLRPHHYVRIVVATHASISLALYLFCLPPRLASPRLASPRKQNCTLCFCSRPRTIWAGEWDHRGQWVSGEGKRRKLGRKGSGVLRIQVPGSGADAFPRSKNNGWLRYWPVAVQGRRVYITCHRSKRARQYVKRSTTLTSERFTLIFAFAIHTALLC